MQREEVYLNCLAYQLSQAHKKVQAWYLKVLAPLELTPSNAYVLGFLKDKGSASPGEIARALELSKPTVTDLLDRMIRNDWILRASNPKSRRSLIVTLTPKGSEICDQAYLLLETADQSLNQVLQGKLDLLKEQVSIINTLI
jgi:DNA-binding MarR family transcriptional regulator